MVAKRFLTWLAAFSNFGERDNSLEKWVKHDHTTIQFRSFVMILSLFADNILLNCESFRPILQVLASTSMNTRNFWIRPFKLWSSQILYCILRFCSGNLKMETARSLKLTQSLETLISPSSMINLICWINLNQLACQISKAYYQQKRIDFSLSTSP